MRYARRGVQMQDGRIVADEAVSEGTVVRPA